MDKGTTLLRWLVILLLLGFTAAAVSQQLAKLEREAGISLVVRHPRGVALTDAGRLLAAAASDVSDIDITMEVAFHKKHGKLATVAAVQPPGRYGALMRDGHAVKGFQEKPLGDGGWINGGFFVLQPEVIDLIASDATSWEQEPMIALSAQKQLMAYEHRGFWQPMDTLREKTMLEELWQSDQAPWKVWK